MRIGTTELLVVLIIVVIVFGPTQIPKLGRILGRGVRGFREGLETEEAPEAPETCETPLSGEQERAYAERE